MPIEATSSGIKRELVPADTHVARCYSMVHIGTIETEYMGEKKLMDKVRITWELPNEMRMFDESKGEQPMVISQEYTLSMHEKSNLRKMLESWRGKGFTEGEAECFDITKLLGITCLLSVIHKISKVGNGYATITGINKLPGTMVCPEQINSSFEFNYNTEFSHEKIESMPDFIKEEIKKSREYRAITKPEEQEIDNEQGKELETEDDLPF